MIVEREKDLLLFVLQEKFRSIPQVVNDFVAVMPECFSLACAQLKQF